ncbi:c-di-AMP phosphodiesterase-like protein [Herbinix hemicellulosilytica]|uniref:Cyclic-di-AMP phosphodiesterase n=1 Tax=Herbinix hemicellulosilytica TaxID=1564487 RepID=A0A0H5SJV8_HERHM|nr:DHH family phosphoesterase [Herbinix hemicellulosilytica]RBP59172.1 c-di-AMP phosphodiesterase-like protein [Herbinix hemicellulosilytica]CRZ35385.1 putative membrane protein [Herbinix hemicellulosilytica]
MGRKFRLNSTLKAYFLWPIYMTVLLLLMNLWIYVINKKAGYVMSVFTLLYFLLALSVFYLKRNQIYTELIRYGMDFAQVQKRLLKEMVVPYALLDNDGKIQWGNNEFADLFQGKKVIGKNISNIIPEITQDVLPKTGADEIAHATLNNRNYRVILRKVISPSFDDDNWTFYESENAWDTPNSIIAMYMFDETEIMLLQKENKNQKLVVGLLYIDNYDEALDSIDEVRRSLLVALVERKINKYMQGIDAIIKKLEKDKFIFVFKQKYLSVLQSTRFSILEEVRNVNIGNEMAVTISIGLGVNADSYITGYEYARAAIDLALGRGGDQAVVKDGDKISYYGGKSIQVEKSTRVKARVKAHAFREYVEAKDKIVVMGHAIGDVDSFGAAIGVYRIGKTFNKKVYIVINEITSSLRPMISRFMENPEYEDDLFINNDKAKEVVDANTLLVIVDVNRPSLLECEELLNYTRTVIIFDHHRQTNEAIENAALSYIEPYASSTCEMIAEILQYIGGNLKLRPLEADALYAGIMIDTNNFLTKTGVRTFEAAAYLRRNGADVIRLRKFFRTEFTEFKIKAEAISSAEAYLDQFAIAICAADEADSPTVLAAKVANELLDVKNIKASFVLTEFNNKIYISARSIDEVNVQVVMEKLGGGGHLSVAGCQLEDITIEEAVIKLKNTLDTMVKEGEI